MADLIDELLTGLHKFEFLYIGATGLDVVVILLAVVGGVVAAGILLSRNFIVINLLKVPHDM